MPNEPKQSPRLLEVAEVAERLKCSERTLEHMMNRGDFPKPLRWQMRKRVWAASTVDRYLQNLIDESEADFLKHSEA